MKPPDCRGCPPPSGIREVFHSFPNRARDHNLTLEAPIVSSNAFEELNRYRKEKHFDTNIEDIDHDDSTSEDQNKNNYQSNAKPNFNDLTVIDQIKTSANSTRDPSKTSTSTTTQVKVPTRNISPRQVLQTPTFLIHYLKVVMVHLLLTILHH